MVHWLNHQWLEPLGPAKCLFGRFLLTLSRIKRPQVMLRVKFSPTALNFGYDFVLLVHSLGHTVVSHCIALMVFAYSPTRILAITENICSKWAPF